MLACIVDFFSKSADYKNVPQGFKFGDLFMSFKSIFQVQLGFKPRNRICQITEQICSQDIRSAVDHIHMEGRLKRLTCDDLQKYVKKDDNLPILLKRLQQAGKITFLLTNSEWWYTNEVRKYQDQIVTFSDDI